MSNKNKNTQKRVYTLKERARRQEEVHRRITMATVELHRTVGPARTTMSEIAKRAGVQRATVYNHFPTELALIDACSSHWIEKNPPPSPEEWQAIMKPARRLETALLALYAYYGRGADMLEKVLRDAPLVPALEEINQRKWWPFFEELVTSLSRGWEMPDGKTADATDVQAPPSQTRADLDAALRVALDFFTWQKLSRAGLSAERASRLATRWVRASVQAGRETLET